MERQGNAMASKQESQQIFEKLKTKAANKVGAPVNLYTILPAEVNMQHRYALIASRTTQHGPRSLLQSTFASIVPRTTATWESISPLSGPRISTVRMSRGFKIRWGLTSYQNGSGNNYGR